MKNNITENKEKTMKVDIELDNEIIDRLYKEIKIQIKLNKKANRILKKYPLSNKH